MSTREEKLKKINEELEKLDDEQLDEVSGGAYWETAQDSEFLKKLGLCNEEFSAEDIALSSGYNNEHAIQSGWGRAGVQFTWKSWLTKNEYSVNNKRVSRAEAYRIALENITGKKVN